MERPVFKPIGTPVDQIDTPALIVDLDALEHNIETLRSFFRNQDAKLRPHVTSHLCPALAHMQLGSDSTVGGISVATVGQAEVFAQNGFTDICLTNETVTSQKINRLCALARLARITVAVDGAGNVRDLAEAARHHDVKLHVLVDIHTGQVGPGVEPGKPALELAKAIGNADNLRFVGLMTYEGAIRTEDPDERQAHSRQWIQQVLDSRELLEKEGLEVEVVSVGGTHNYEVAGAMAGVTEVPAGSYALMDESYRLSRPQLKIAARVLTTVMSHVEQGTAMLDAGQKGIAHDRGLAVIDGIPGATLTRMSAEHGFVDLEGDAQDQVDLKDKVWLTPWDIGDCANLYDYIHAVRGGKLEAVWDVAARGRYR